MYDRDGMVVLLRDVRRVKASPKPAPQITREAFRALIDEGQELRRAFDRVTRPMRWFDGVNYNEAR